MALTFVASGSILGGSRCSAHGDRRQRRLLEQLFWYLGTDRRRPCLRRLRDLRVCASSRGSRGDGTRRCGPSATAAFLGLQSANGHIERSAASARHDRPPIALRMHGHVRDEWPPMTSARASPPFTPARPPVTLVERPVSTSTAPDINELHCWRYENCDFDTEWCAHADLIPVRPVQWTLRLNRHGH